MSFLLQILCSLLTGWSHTLNKLTEKVCAKAPEPHLGINQCIKGIECNGIWKVAVFRWREFSVKPQSLENRTLPKKRGKQNLQLFAGYKCRFEKC